MLIDLVNLNPHASCLSESTWLESLQGGDKSKVYQWLNQYVINRKKINLGITAAGVLDIQNYCPSAINLINQNKDIFELMLRPFSHDICVLRSSYRAKYLNVALGAIIYKECFKHVPKVYLPPELTIDYETRQIIKKFGIELVILDRNDFLNTCDQPDSQVSFSTSCGIKHGILIDKKISKNFYDILNDVKLNFDKKPGYNKIYLWRDGETFLILGLDPSIEINALNVISNKSFHFSEFLNESAQNHINIPVHSICNWKSNFKLISLESRIDDFEKDIVDSIENSLSLAMWGYLISSDILSSAEKPAPLVRGSNKNKIFRIPKWEDAENLINTRNIESLEPYNKALAELIKSRGCWLSENKCKLIQLI